MSLEEEGGMKVGVSNRGFKKMPPDRQITKMTPNRGNEELARLRTHFFTVIWLHSGLYKHILHMYHVIGAEVALRCRKAGLSPAPTMDFGPGHDTPSLSLAYVIY
jgi:hypothetical protein